MIVELSVVPVGTGATSVSSYVKAAVKTIEQNGLDFEVNPMGTCVQGDWDEIFSALKAVHEELAKMGCRRIITTVKIDDRRDKFTLMDAKVAAVAEGL